jgi:pyruvate dehydrogenase E1 component alpha subunit
MYGEYTPTKKVMVIADVVDRAPGYGMPGVIVDGMDVLAVHGATVEAVARARGGEGPTLIEAKTYRFYNHHGIQNLGLKYRPDDEVIAWKARDPITSFEQWLIEGGVANREDLDAVWAELRATIGAAVEFAEQSPFPDESQLLAGVYTGSGE